jgi:hypothetical protein
MQMNQNVKGIWLGGVASSAAVAVAAALRSSIERRSMWRPINAISHIVWGRRAAKETGCTIRYTITGLVLNTIACVFWAGCYRVWHQRTSDPKSLMTSSLLGLGTSAVAYLTDYHVVPRRFTPGFELSLSRRSFPWVYAALAVGLMLPDLLGRRRT